PIDMTAAIGGSVALFILAMARMNGMVHKHEDAEGRERALRQAGASFVRATGREGLYQATIEATHGLTGPDAEILLALAESADGLLTVVATSGRSPRSERMTSVDPSRFPPEVSAALAARQTAQLEVLDDRLRSTLGLSPAASTALIAPLYMRG